MTYVFFDCECANCLNGEGKICSLGFVRTDGRMIANKKKDILMDPQAPFLLGNAETGNGIRLGYPLFRFRWAHTFPSYYQEIANLFTKDPDTLAIGFSVHQDIRYLIYTCQRYHKAMIDFRFFDVQICEQHLHKRKNPAGLDTLIEMYHLQPETYHRSDDDADMTRAVLMGMLEETGMTMDELIKAYPEAMNDVKSFKAELARREKVKLQKQKHKEAINKFYETVENTQLNISDYNAKINNKVVYFDYPLFNEDITELTRLGVKITKAGGVITRSPQQANIVILKDQMSPSKTIPYGTGAKFMSYSEIRKIIVK